MISLINSSNKKHRFMASMSSGHRMFIFAPGVYELAEEEFSALSAIFTFKALVERGDFKVSNLTSIQTLEVEEAVVASPAKKAKKKTSKKKASKKKVARKKESTEKQPEPEGPVESLEPEGLAEPVSS